MEHAALAPHHQSHPRRGHGIMPGDEIDNMDLEESAILLLDTDYQDVAFVRNGRIPMRKVYRCLDCEN